METIEQRATKASEAFSYPSEKYLHTKDQLKQIIYNAYCMGATEQEQIDEKESTQQTPELEKYRPFESVKEIADAMAEHGSWVKWCYNHDWLLLITGYSHKCIDFGNKYLTLEEACNEYVFADGTPFGKRVEE